MTTTKYSRYRPELFDDMDISDLLDELSDFLLNSGFSDQFGFTELSDHTMQALREALRS